MRTFPDQRIRELVWKSQKAQQLLDEGEHEQAKALFLELIARARKLEVSSVWLSWGLAVACDCLREFDLAFNAISEAVFLDPLNPVQQRSFDVICSHIRTELADEDRAPDDPDMPKLYRLLVGAGEADVPSHLAMARYLGHTGKSAEALAMLEAVTLLAPISREAWVEKAALARAMGDGELAMRCDAEAAAVSVSPIPFNLNTSQERNC